MWIYIKEFAPLSCRILKFIQFHVLQTAFRYNQNKGGSLFKDRRDIFGSFKISMGCSFHKMTHGHFLLFPELLWPVLPAITHKSVPSRSRPTATKFQLARPIVPGKGSVLLLALCDLWALPWHKRCNLWPEHDNSITIVRIGPKFSDQPFFTWG